MDPCVFLDRDGVLIEDVDLLARVDQVRVLPGATAAVRRLRAAGLRVVVVTNQAVVARGVASEADVEAVHRDLQLRFAAEGAAVDAWYYCPHHPQATLAAYRRDCGCRKPRPGMLLRGRDALGLDLRRSFMVGDRVTDVAAGSAAGCRTIQVLSGRHDAPPIETTDAVDTRLLADHVCPALPDAVDWILGARAA